ncbi:DegT/DnrJ/EryC1/StrS aminotransferase family protein [Butyrivibrio sp. YAB3001]|uniref:DegT/DnrJ/EryC1/StrS aminotransferase family protein n=1 Tax=Butyrivibrio sp. YAB3001 TaxID=1520812 RepID=UPI0008F63CC4|nr:DegT/DnrJ/EryC1/StrS family aminotransferase [Butyrivibrio sp. YAB3001]SFC94291.1 dTDP-4-amino-4,6-dideoxygalactose transaminase [Butyrivibrio sp. YAB3001]
MVIPFDEECRKRYYGLLDKVFDSNMWSDGKMQRQFESMFEEYCGLGSCAVSSGGTGLITILDYIGIEGKDVVVPANTFWATAQAVKKCGGNVVYADCNRDDLCLSLESLKNVVTPNTKAVIVVHIGGHIAFQIEKIKEFCNQNSIYLIEDCAHAHGADWNGKKAGSWGFAGSYSFYATKTLPLGEGGMVVSSNKKFIEFAKKYRNYGKEVIEGHVTYPIKNGFNYRINEMTAALGIVQMEQFDRILEWKRCLAEKYDKVFENRVHFPEGMTSGYYKYIVFDYELTEVTGQVFGYDDLGYRIEGKSIELPNSEWVVKHHQCVPIFYGWDKAELDSEELRKCLVR